MLVSRNQSRHLFLSMPKPARKVLVALDFDHTVINENSDTSIYKLAPDKTIPPDIKALYRKSGWTHYMGEVFKYLHKNGVIKKDLLHCIEKNSLTDGMAELLTSLPTDRTELVIISDSNDIFIKHILKSKGMYDVFSEIYTNFAEFDNSGCLTIRMYHYQNTCDLSTVNLCKGDILSKYVNKRFNEGVEFVRIAYIGDGFNDFCPSLRLNTCDGVFPRINYELIETIQQMEREKKLKVRAKIYPWSSGREILDVVQSWYSDLNHRTIPDPRLFDPGITDL